MSWRIAPFRPGLEGEVLDLVRTILGEEFGGEAAAAGQPDLLRIPELYQRGRGGFWVGLAGERVVGTLGLLDFSSGGALRKMYVHQDYRGSGLAQGLLDLCLVQARSAGLAGLWLGTLGHMHAAHRFYQRNGFQRVDAATLPMDFPRVAVDTAFFQLDLE